MQKQLMQFRQAIQKNEPLDLQPLLTISSPSKEQIQYINFNVIKPLPAGKKKTQRFSQFKNRTPDTCDYMTKTGQNFVNKRTSQLTLSEDSQSNLFTFYNRLSSKFVVKDNFARPSWGAKSDESRRSSINNGIPDVIIPREKRKPVASISLTRTPSTIIQQLDEQNTKDLSFDISEMVETIKKKQHKRVYSKNNFYTPVNEQRKFYLGDDNNEIKTDQILLQSQKPQTNRSFSTNKGITQPELKDYGSLNSVSEKQNAQQSIRIQGKKSVIIRAKLPRIQVIKKLKPIMEIKETLNTINTQQSIEIQSIDPVEVKHSKHTFSKDSNETQKPLNKQFSQKIPNQHSFMSKEISLSQSNFHSTHDMRTFDSQKKPYFKIEENGQQIKDEKPTFMTQPQFINESQPLTNHAFKILKQNQSQPLYLQISQTTNQSLGTNSKESKEKSRQKPQYLYQRQFQFNTENKIQYLYQKPPIQRQMKKKRNKQLPPMSKRQNETVHFRNNSVSPIVQQMFRSSSMEHNFQLSLLPKDRQIIKNSPHQKIARIKQKQTLKDLFKDFIVQI